MPSWRPDPGSVSCCQCHEHHVCVKTGKSACYVETGHSSACASWPCCQVRPRQPVRADESSTCDAPMCWPGAQLDTTSSPPPVLSSGEHSRAEPSLWKEMCSPRSPRHGWLLQSTGSTHVLSPYQSGQFLPTYQPREALVCARGGVCTACCGSWTISRASAKHQPLSDREDSPLPAKKLAREGERGSGVPVQE